MCKTLGGFVHLTARWFFVAGPLHRGGDRIPCSDREFAVYQPRGMLLGERNPRLPSWVSAESEIWEGGWVGRRVLTATSASSFCCSSP